MDRRPIDIEIAKHELVRINEKLSQPHLLIGGLAVQRYVVTRDSKDIDLVCEHPIIISLLKELYPLHDWKIEEPRDNSYRPCYTIRHRYENYGEIILGPKPKERQAYDFIDWDYLLENGIQYEFQGKALQNIVIPACSDLAFTKLISFLDRDKDKLDKRKNDLQDLTNLSNKDEFSINNFIDLIKMSGAESFIQENWVLSDEEESIFCNSSIRRQDEIFGVTKTTFPVQLENSPSIPNKVQHNTQVETIHQSPMRSPVSDEYYIERDEVKKLRECFANALQQPQGQPLLFNIYGIGGVGKTTSIGRLQKAHASEVDFIEVCFAKTSGVETPLKLMRKLHQLAIQLLDAETITDAFTQREQQFEATLSQLSQQTVDGKATSSEESRKITSWFERSIWLGSTGFTSVSNKSNSFETLESGFSTLSKMEENAEDLQEWIQQRVRNHPATKDQPELQALMLEPVSKLTQAFADSLIQIAQSRGKPLVLILDTYEKARSYLNQWLWQHLVEDTPLHSQPVRLVVVGRRSLQADEGWRKLNQDRNLLYETHLKKFDKKDTQTYLERIGIGNGGQRAKIFKATQGLPYYLDWVRKKRDKGEELDFSQGNQAIAKLLLQGIDSQQRRILQVVACCRWFDLPMIKYLLGSDRLGLKLDADNVESSFEWLKSSDFVEFRNRHYRLDDVARDVFRQSYFQDNRNLFRDTHDLLANYFKQQAEDLFDDKSLLPDPYKDEEWREIISEFLYHSLFGKKNEGLRQYIEYVFVAVYLQEPDVFIAPFNFIDAEINEENRHLLPKATNKFFKDAAIVLTFGWFFLDKSPKSDKFKFEGENTPSEREIEELSKKIELSIQSLLEYVGDLGNGFGKSVGLVCKSIRCNRPRERTDLLLQAKSQIEQISTNCRPKLIHSFFANLGYLFGSTEHYQDSLDCYEKATEFDPNSANAWFYRGVVLSELERYEEALDSCQKAVDIDPKYAKAWVSQGNILRRMKRYEEDIFACEQALTIDPENDNALNSQALTLSLLKDCEKAITAIDKAINLQPQKALFRANRGIILARAGRYAEAITDCEQAIKQDPKDEGGYYAKACCFALQGEVEQATDYLKQAIDIAPHRSRIEAKTNPDFDNIRDDERFRALVYPDSTS
ncbi:MAG: tetratricopeptide repeat protein [Calothrix sp. MO_192.B10]|nr:tetratricopeptide repeat protein [Calothrix sp. MO_192.B10]